MKNLFVFGSAAKKAFQSLLLLAMFLPMVVASTPVPMEEASCPEPTPVVANQTSGSIQFNWASIAGTDGYEVSYTREADGYTSEVTFTTAASITYTGLPAGSYVFQFRSVCGGVPGVIVTTDVMMI